MKQFCIHPIILLVFSCSLTYWSYLAFNTRMEISCDAIGYEDLGKLIKTQGFIPAYFEHGPNREPVYPFLISLSMHLQDIVKIPYTKIMAIFGVGILSISQILLFRILSLLRLNLFIISLTLLYFGLSPAILNTAFSLYSEIIALPFVLAIILTGAQAIENITNRNLLRTFLFGSIWGLLFALASLGKGNFEVIYILSSVLILTLVFIKLCTKQVQTAVLILLFLLGSALCFYPPVLTYKALNAKYNGSFSITNRFPWMFYGSAVRRAQPLTMKKILTALAYTPGEGVCASLFSAADCFYWSFQTTDGYGLTRLHELSSQVTNIQVIDKTLIKESIQKIQLNPLQQILLQGLEGIRIFFWESTQIGFVSYPQWLKNVYDVRLFNNALRFMTALLSLVSTIWLWRQCLRPQCTNLMRCVGIFNLIFIFSFSFVSILTRYALPIAPLFLISIAYFLNFMYNKIYAQNRSAS